MNQSEPGKGGQRVGVPREGGAGIKVLGEGEGDPKCFKH